MFMFYWRFKVQIQREQFYEQYSISLSISCDVNPQGALNNEHRVMHWGNYKTSHLGRLEAVVFWGSFTLSLRVSTIFTNTNIKDGPLKRQELMVSFYHYRFLSPFIYNTRSQNKEKALYPLGRALVNTDGVWSAPVIVQWWMRLWKVITKTS